MNHKHILDLTLRLSQALDQNYDVVSMETVLSVIYALEGATITKEQLEATRLAKYINQLRRRTKSDNLARRAKSLLKKWREMVGIQHTNETTATTAAIGTGGTTASGTSNSMLSSTTAPANIPVTDNAVSTSQLTTQQLQYQRHQNHNNTKQQQSCHSQPTSPLSYLEKSNPNEFLNSTMSNPASVALLSNKTGNLTERKKKRLEKIAYEQHPPPPQQPPTSFANLLTGLGSSNSFSLRKPRDKCGTGSSSAKPMETFVIEHSSNSNSNSDLICMPSNTVSTYTSVKNVPPIVIDLQDTNSSMNSLVSKDVTNAFSSFSTKPATKLSKKEKKRKERDTLQQNQTLHDCDDNNTTTNASYHQQRPPDTLIVEEKSHSACPTISNISEILSLSNSSMSSVFPSTDAISKNICDSGQNELGSSHKMSKSDLTFAGKFKQNTSSTSTLSEVLNYNNDSLSVNVTAGNRSTSPNKNKFTPFGGIGMVTNSSDSTSNSHISQFNVGAVKKDACNNKQNIEELQLKHDSNDKSMSNMSNKGGNSSTDVFAVAPSAIISQQHQSIDLTTTDFSSEQTIKQPKKRGRKKGSKGVDSVIAKETSLSSQMLISSLSAGGKKVKTTKELYAEMQNRKLQSVSMAASGGVGSVGDTIVSPPITWQQQQQKPLISRHGSSCSDIAESDSCTMTSEPSRDSANTPKAGKREIPLDSNSNYSQFDTELKTNDVELEGGTPTASISTVSLTTANIKNQISKILTQLTPPPTIKDIELECLNDITPCTCTIIEIIPKTEKDDDNGEYPVNNINTDAFSCATNDIEAKVEENPQQIKVENTTHTAIVVNSDEQKDSLQQQPSKKLKKSIFDLDFDDDEDPLNSIIADIAGKNSKANLNLEKKNTSPTIDDNNDDAVGNTVKLKIEKDPAVKYEAEQHSDDVVVLPPTTENNIAFPTYDLKLDPDCKAKIRFDIQTQKITKFHIDALHNCFIPNVNGNWNHADVATSDINILRNSNVDSQDINSIIDGYGVVPYYGSEINEHIVKDLSHVKFTKKFRPKPRSFTKNEIFDNIPFMGAARVIIKSLNKKYGPRKHHQHIQNPDENLISKSHHDNVLTQVESNEAATDLHKTSIEITKNNNNNSSTNNNKSVEKVEMERESSLLNKADLEVVNYTNSEVTVTSTTDYQKTVNEVSEFVYNTKKMEKVQMIESSDVETLQHSRRSSSSSNSNNSLKQSQQTINLKFKQQREEKKKLLRELEAKSADTTTTVKSNLKRTKKTFKETNLHSNKRLKFGTICNIVGTTRTPSSSSEYLISDDYQNDSDTGTNAAKDNDFDEEDENEEEEENEEDDYNGDYHHEVVTHDISAANATTGRKHIVLTIKKTPSKTISPLNFVAALSPVLNTNSNIDSLENNVEYKNSKIIEEKDIQKEKPNQTLNHNQHVRKAMEEEQEQEEEEGEQEEEQEKKLCKAPKKITRFKFFKKRLKWKKVSSLTSSLPYSSGNKIKLHKLLFFPDEICPVVQLGTTQRHNEYIFNISSCSSSGTDEGEKEFYINSQENDDNDCNKNLTRIRSPSISSSSSSSSQCSERSMLDLSAQCESDYQMTAQQTVEDDDIVNDGDDVPEENNLMLLTFNNIYCKTIMCAKECSKHENEQQQNPLRQDKEGYPENMLKQQLQNCDDYNNLYNNSNFNLIKYIDNKSSLVNNNIINSCSNNYSDQVYNNNSSISSSSHGNCNSYVKHENDDNDNDENAKHKNLQQITAYKEYHTGIRAVDEDVDDAHGNNCGRLQQFKEWHEVLQLRSYNDELLTVLPYVVLE